MAALTAGAERFAQRLSQLSGLDIAVVRAWVAHETAYGTKMTGSNNYLNMRGTAGGWREFATPEQGAAAAYRQLQVAPDWYGGILATHGAPAGVQIAAIAGSPWDAGHYGGSGGPNLVRTYDSMTGQKMQPWGGSVWNKIQLYTKSFFDWQNKHFGITGKFPKDSTPSTRGEVTPGLNIPNPVNAVVNAIGGAIGGWVFELALDVGLMLVAGGLVLVGAKQLFDKQVGQVPVVIPV